MTTNTWTKLTAFPVLATVVALSLSGCASTSQSSPAGVTEKLLQAVSEQNIEEMKKYLTPAYAEQTYASQETTTTAEPIENIKVDESTVTEEDTTTEVTFSYTLNDEPLTGSFQLTKTTDKWLVDSPVGANVSQLTIPAVLDSETALPGVASEDEAVLLPGVYPVTISSPSDWIEPLETGVDVPVVGEISTSLTPEELVEQVELTDELQQLMEEKALNAVNSYQYLAGSYDPADYAAADNGIDNRFRVDVAPRVGEAELRLDGQDIIVATPLTDGKYSLYDSLGDGVFDWVPEDGFSEALGMYNGSEMVIDLR